MGELSTALAGGNTPTARTRCVACEAWFDVPPSGYWTWTDRLYWRGTSRCEPCARGAAELLEASDPGRQRWSEEEWWRPMMAETRSSARPPCAGRTLAEALALREPPEAPQARRQSAPASSSSAVVTRPRRRRSDVRR